MSVIGVYDGKFTKNQYEVYTIKKASSIQGAETILPDPEVSEFEMAEVQ